MNPFACLLAVCLLPSLALFAAEKPITLWPDGTPGALSTATKDIPKPTPDLPAKSTGAAILLILGNSYRCSDEAQAEPFALWLNEQNIAAFALRFRLNGAGYRYPAQLQQAVFQIRGHAAQWNIGPERA